MIKPNLSAERPLFGEQSPDVCEAALSAIHRLRDAYDAAFACGRDPWDFSVEFSEMQRSGVETHVLRMLICKNWIIHKRETTLEQESKRTFKPVDGFLILTERSCFVISKLGYEVAKSTQQVVKQIQLGRTEMSSHHSGPSGGNQENKDPNSNQLGSSSRPHAQIKPVWDRERRDLSGQLKIRSSSSMRLRTRNGPIVSMILCSLTRVSAPSVVCMTH